MGLFSSNHFQVDGRTVLITGGSKGLGRSAGRQLAAKGANVTIVARDVEALKEATKHISDGARDSKAQRFHWISADLSIPAEAVRAISECTAHNDGRPADIVWCCAGTSNPHLFVDTPIEKFHEQMNANYFSALHVAHATLNAWIYPSHSKSSSTTAASIPEAGPGDKGASAPSIPLKPNTPSLPRHLIFTASFVSFYTFAGYAPYSPTKAALRSLSDSLSSEMNLYNAHFAAQSKGKGKSKGNSDGEGADTSPAPAPIRVHTVFPAGILTEGLENENKIKADITKKLEEGDAGQTPDECARVSIAGLESGRELIPTTLLTRAVMAPSLGGSVRGGSAGWGGSALVDTLLAWVMVLVVVFVRWDMDGTIRKWGRTKGVRGREDGAGDMQR